MNIREHLELIESKTLRKEAAFSTYSKGRKFDESCNLRTCYQQDRDKIIHSKAFRRLAGKTQVFLSPVGDHYRTRFTHTLEVSQIARSIAKALQLNESLTEAIALAHDLGHTPFGHIGEEVLNKIYPKGFHHVKHSIRIVEHIEKEGHGLNLTYEVIDGIACHSKGRGPIISKDTNLKAKTLEGQIVRIADIIAYINHDIDDAVRAGLLKPENIPQKIADTIGNKSSTRIHNMVSDVITTSLKNDPIEILLSPEMQTTIKEIRDFMFHTVYENTRANRSFDQIFHLLSEIYNFYIKHPDKLQEETEIPFLENDIERTVCDYIANMTDRYAIHTYEKLFIPKAWSIL